VVNDIEFLVKILLVDSVLLYEVCNDTVWEQKTQRRRKNGTTYAVSPYGAGQRERERERQMENGNGRVSEKWREKERELGYWTSSNHKISTLLYEGYRGSNLTATRTRE